MPLLEKGPVGGNVEPRHLAKGDGVITPAERKTLGR